MQANASQCRRGNYLSYTTALLFGIASLVKIRVLLSGEASQSIIVFGEELGLRLLVPVAIASELALAIFCCFFPRHRWVYLLSRNMWITLSILSASLVFFGIHQCPCFGSLLSSEAVLVIDLFMSSMYLLHIGRRPQSQVVDNSKAAFLSPVFFALVASLFVVVAWDAHRSQSNIPWASGIGVQIKQSGNDEGDPEFVGFDVELTNRRSVSVDVVGSRASCSCVALSELPINLPANTSVILHPKVNVSNGRGKISQSVQYFVQGESIERLVVQLSSSGNWSSW